MCEAWDRCQGHTPGTRGTSLLLWLFSPSLRREPFLQDESAQASASQLSGLNGETITRGIWDANTSSKLFFPLSPPLLSSPPFTQFSNHLPPPSVANALDTVMLKCFLKKAMKYRRIILLSDRFRPTVSSKDTWEDPPPRPYSQGAVRVLNTSSPP